MMREQIVQKCQEPFVFTDVGKIAQSVKFDEMAQTGFPS